MPSMGLGLDPPRNGIMSKQPRKPGEKILKKGEINVRFSKEFIGTLSREIANRVGEEVY